MKMSLFDRQLFLVQMERKEEEEEERTRRGISKCMYVKKETSHRIYFNRKTRRTHARARESDVMRMCTLPKISFFASGQRDCAFFFLLLLFFLFQVSV